MDLMIRVPNPGSVVSGYTLPKLPEEYLDIIYQGGDGTEIGIPKNHLLPLADSDLFLNENLIGSRKLTHGEDVKEIFLVELPSHRRLYEPGDTIGILPCNPENDLVQLFSLLRISHLVHEKCKIVEKCKAEKLNLKPVFINELTTLYDIFKYQIDIRSIPKKSFIRLLAEYTSDETERFYLEQLCSKEGAEKYKDEVLNCNRTLSDILSSCQTCNVPVVRVLENLPALIPRIYSIASSPLSSPGTIKIIFTVAKSEVNGIEKEGICTGMLKSIILNQGNTKPAGQSIKMFYRKPSIFRLPKNNTCPLILIGPGSGVAPFIGFLEHRKFQRLKNITWLFYGCRYKNRDYLFKKELQEYLACGALTKLAVSFSREPGESVKYVQDNLRNYGREICDMMFNEDAIIYVCGDVNGLKKDVMNAFVEILGQHKGLTTEEGKKFMKTLQKEKRYLQDIWL